MKKNNITSEDVHIFAYLRRSTNKKEQEDSLVQQEDGIGSIVRKLGLEKQEKRYFAETYSGFENKKRKQWTRMLEEIDKAKTPCIILCRDISRLSRNPTDSQKIMDRVYGDNGFKKNIKIGKIFSLDYERVKEWDSNTDKEDMHKALSASYYDSLDTRRKSIGGILLKLENGEFPYHAPKGLQHTILNGKKVMKQNDKMPFVIRAFGMKTERKGHKEISKYLRRYGKIKMGEKELTDRLFSNTVYIGEYTEKTTGKEFKNLHFFEQKPPIPLVLWNKVQVILSKRGRVYRSEEEKDVFEERGRTDGGGLLARDPKTKETKKGKKVYMYYKNTKDSINISKDRILDAFIKDIYKIFVLWAKPFVEEKIKKRDSMTLSTQELINNTDAEIVEDFRDILDAMKKVDDEIAGRENNEGPEVRLHDIFKELNSFTENDWNEHDKSRKTIITEIFKSAGIEIDANFYEYGQRMAEDKEIMNKSDSFIKTIFKHSPYLVEEQELKNIRKLEILRLEGEKMKLLEERKQYRKKAIMADFNELEIEEVTREIDGSVRIIQEEISELSESTDMEETLERLPEILREIVELSTHALVEEENESGKANLEKLFKITVSNFSVSTKKELKIELFEVLNTLINGGKFNLEAPSGVEPDYGALQAPA